MPPGPPKSLKLNSILEKLQTRQLGRALQILDKCTSTNDVATQLAKSGAQHGYLVVAEEQSAGRGRQNRCWISPRGGIWMTLILQPSLGFDHLDTLPLIGAMAAGKAINSQLGVRTNVRWPNDIVVGRRKLAGVLAESRFSGNQSKYVLLGLGINANFLPRELIDFAPTSTTLLEICGSPVDREDLICALLLEIEQLYDQAVCNRDDELMNLLHGLDCSTGQRVEIKKGNEEISGVLEGYETLTKVRVRTTQGRLTTLETSSVVSVSYVDL